MTTCKEIVIEGHPSGPGRRPEGLPRGRPGVLPLRARAHEVRRPHGAALRGGAGPAVRRQAGKTKKSPFTSLSFTFVSI